MAVRRNAKTAAKPAEEAGTAYTCNDCKHAYDRHSQALDGHMILCRCKHDAKSEHGKWCKFTRDRACSEFKHI